MKRPPELSKMTKAKLTFLARRKKIPLASGMLKEDMLKAIKKGLRKIEAQKKSGTAAKAKKKTKAKSAAKKTAKNKKSKKVKRSPVKKAKTARQPKTATRKKAARRKSPVKVKSAKSKVKKPAPREPEVPRSQPQETGLPASYGDDRLAVMPRDPNWAYAYWDLTPARVRDLSRGARTSGGQPRWILRVYSAALHPEVEKGSYFDVKIDIKEGSYYLDLSRPGARFIVEIGVVDASGVFQSAAQSNPVILPMDHPSETTAPQGIFDSGSLALQQKTPSGTRSSDPAPGEATSPRGSSFGGPSSSESHKK